MASRPCTTAKEDRIGKWSQEINQIVMECFYNSNPEVMIFIKRINMIWKEKRMFNVNEQRVLDQK